MLRVMLCGASDTSEVRAEFTEVVTNFGGESLHYLSGDVLYRNSMSSSWSKNASATVMAADLCVFVIVKQYGPLTWATELTTALAEGKPFLFFCLNSTLQRYFVLKGLVADLGSSISDSERQLVTDLRRIESERMITIVPFEYGQFKELLRRHLARQFTETLHLLEAMNKRDAVAHILSGVVRLSADEVVRAKVIATDELEDKQLRKRAILALVRQRAVDDETARSLLGSAEQGVQRIAISLLSNLYVERPVENDFVDFCVAVANDSDDVGVMRRMIPALLELDVATALPRMEGLKIVEVGSRRRLFEVLEAHEDEIIRLGFRDELIGLVRKCLATPEESTWTSRCKALEQRLLPR